MIEETQSAACRVVIVDDHAMVRESIALALGRSPEIDVVGSAASVREGRAMVQELHPDVAVLDYALPDGTGIELAISVHEGDPPTRTILLTASEGVQSAAEAVSAGCSGFVRKSADLDDLAAGVLRVHGGEAILMPRRCPLRSAGSTVPPALRSVSPIGSWTCCAAWPRVARPSTSASCST